MNLGWIEIGIVGEHIAIDIDDVDVGRKLLNEDEALATALVLLGKIIELRKHRRQR